MLWRFSQNQRKSAKLLTKLWVEIFFRYSATAGNGMLFIELQEKIPAISHQNLQKRLNTIGQVRKNRHGVELPRAGRRMCFSTLFNKQWRPCWRFKVGDSLSCSNHEIVNFSILWGGSMATSKIQSQASEKLALASSRIFLEESHEDGSCREEGSESWLIFKNHFLQSQKQSSWARNKRNKKRNKQETRMDV